MGNHSKYDVGFKQNAVGLVESGQTAAQVARDLGVPVERLYQWVKQYRQKRADMSKELVMEALQQAIGRRNAQPGLILHFGFFCTFA